MQFTTEVLPAPLGPISARSSPCLTSKETSSRTFRPPKARETPESASSELTIPAPGPAVLLDVTIAASRTASRAKIELTYVLVRPQPLRSAVQHDPAALHDVAVVCGIECKRRVL